MTRFLLIPALALALTACATDTAEPAAEVDETATAETPDSGAEMGDATVTIGDAPEDGAEILLVSAAIEQADALSGQTIAVEGTVSKVCQMRGCWLTLASDTGETFRIVVPKDDAGEYVFTFPMDATGATAQVVGAFAVETEDVDMQRHLAEDEGQTAEQVEAITEPQTTYVLTASGARLVRA